MRIGTLFARLTRTQIVLSFIFLMLLRIVVGYHFFKEGTAKLESGTFTSKYFLSAAKGPLAPMYKNMIDDADGSERLCIKKVQDEQSGEVVYQIDPELTELIWSDFLDRAASYYGFGSVELQEKLAADRESLAKEIREARAVQDSTVDTDALELKRDRLEQKILAIRDQLKNGKQILDSHIDRLNDWLGENELELISYFAGAKRLQGFDRDGDNRQQAALYVDSLRGQVDTIRSDRQKKLAGWTKQVEALWDSYERMINELPVEEQIAGDLIAVHRPFDQEGSVYKIVDKVIPWFDTIVGVSLILGLFARFTSLAAAGFLASVILSQPPWVPGTDPTYFYFIEMMALLVIFAVGAGRLGGLDYFLDPVLFRRPARAENLEAATTNSRQPEGQLA